MGGAAREGGTGGLTAGQVEATVRGVVRGVVGELDKVVRGWQTLAEERAREVVELRTRVRELEEEIRSLRGEQPESRRGWLGRFGSRE